MPPETVPEWGEAELQTALQEEYGTEDNFADLKREEISTWFERGSSLAVWKRQDGVRRFVEVPAGSQPLAADTWSAFYSLEAVIMSSPFGQIA